MDVFAQGDGCTNLDVYDMAGFSCESVSKATPNVIKPWNHLACPFGHKHVFSCEHPCFNWILAGSLTQYIGIVAEVPGTYKNLRQRPSYQHGRPSASKWPTWSCMCHNAGWKVMALREGHVRTTPHKTHCLPLQTLQREQETHGNGHNWQAYHGKW